MMNGLASVIAGTLCLPIWYYLLYQVLTRVNATELMWFLYWIYVPATAVVQIVRSFLEKD